MLEHRDYYTPSKFSQRTLLGTLWAGVAVSFCFLLFRFYVRLKIFRRLHIEDPFVLAAWLMNLANAVVWQKNANQLYTLIAVESGVVTMPPPELIPHIYVGLHSLFASSLLYYTALWSVKLSFLMFFRNLDNSIRRQRMLWYCVLAFTLATYITCLGMINYKCVVEAGGLAECKSAHATHYSTINLQVATTFDTTTDALIILVSTNLLWNASIEYRKKLALTGIFSLTIFIISISIIRVVLTTSGSRLDITWLLLWSGLEVAVAIIVACLASFRLLYISSERLRRSTQVNGRSDTATELENNRVSIPLNARVVSPTVITASETTRHKRPTSTDTFEEAILPMENFYPSSKHSFFYGSRTRYEELPSPLETPSVRLHRLPLYNSNRNTLS